MTTLSGWTVDWNLSPRLITIPEGTETVTAQDQVDTVRKLEDTFRAMSEPRLMDASGKAGGGVTGIVITLQNAQYAFAARSNVLETGTVTTADPKGILLTDINATFLANNVARGDLIINQTTGGHTTVLEVTDETHVVTLAIVGGTDAEWGSGDSYDVFNYDNTQLLAGDLFAVDTAQLAITAILTTFGVGPAVVEQDTSPSAAPGADATIIQIASDADIIRKVVAGRRVEIVGTDPQVINIYGDDGLTIEHTFNATTDLRTRTKV